MHDTKQKILKYNTSWQIALKFYSIFINYKIKPWKGKVTIVIGAKNVLYISSERNQWSLNINTIKNVKIIVIFFDQIPQNM